MKQRIAAYPVFLVNGVPCGGSFAALRMTPDSAHDDASSTYNARRERNSLRIHS